MFPQMSDFLVIGHRGWPTIYPDNTLVGLLAAAALTGAVEVDVRRSGDGKLVLAHDPVLGDLDVASNSWTTLGEVDLGGGHKPCLLDEALASLPDARVMIEIKNDPASPGFEPDHRLGLEAAARSRPGDVVTSFNWESVRLVRDHFPECKTGLIVGLLGDLGEAHRLAASSGHATVVAHVGLLQPETHSPSSLPTYVWSGEESDLANWSRTELESLGVSGIITNDPGRTRQRLGIDS